MLLLLRFLRFFQNQKKRDFLSFFALLYTFSQTMVGFTLGLGWVVSFSPFHRLRWVVFTTLGPKAICPIISYFIALNALYYSVNMLPVIYRRRMLPVIIKNAAAKRTKIPPMTCATLFIEYTVL